MRRILLSLVPLLLAVPALAQSDPASIDSRSTCRSAAAVVSTGSVTPADRWAIERISSCGPEGGAALAAAFAAQQRGSDVEGLDALTRPTRELHDANVFAAAYNVARDREGSTPEARIFALRTLIWVVRPELSIEYADLAGNQYGRTACMGSGPAAALPSAQGAPLPEGYDTVIRGLAVQMTQDPSESAQMRTAALCLRMAVR